MILNLIFYTVVYLLIVWIGNLIISSFFTLIDFASKKIKSDFFNVILLIITSILHFIIGFYFNFLLVTKLCEFYNDKYRELTLLLLIPIILSYSLMKSVGVKINNQIQLDEDRHISSGNYYRANMENTTDITIRRMRANFFNFINTIGLFLNIILFLFYYFDKSIFISLLNYFP